MVGGVLEAQLQEQDKDLAFMKLTFYGRGRQMINNKLDKWV